MYSLPILARRRRSVLILRRTLGRTAGIADKAPPAVSLEEAIDAEWQLAHMIGVVRTTLPGDSWLAATLTVMQSEVEDAALSLRLVSQRLEKGTR